VLFFYERQSAMAKETVGPGGKVPDSGIYRGTKSGEQVTLVRNKTAPPTPQRGEKWKQVVDTNPKNDRR
jgi:hypothetical protein